MMNNGYFDATQTAPISGGISSLPVGEHYVRIVSCEPVKLNSGDGGRLKFVFEGTQGDAVGIQAQWGANIWHPKPETAKKAEGQLSGLCHAAGVMRVNVNAGCPELIGRMVWVLSTLKRDPEDAAKGYTEISQILYKGPSGGNSKPQQQSTPFGAPPAQAQQAAPVAPQTQQMPQQTQAPQQDAWGPQAGQTSPQQTAPAAKMPWEA